MIPQAPSLPGILNGHDKEKLNMFRASVDKGEREMKSAVEVSEMSINKKLSLLRRPQGV